MRNRLPGSELRRVYPFPDGGWCEKTSLLVLCGVSVAPMSAKNALDPRRDCGGVGIVVAKSVAIVCEVPLLTSVTDREFDIDGEGGPIEPVSKSPPTSKNETFFLVVVPVDNDGDGIGRSSVERCVGLTSPSSLSTISCLGVSGRLFLSEKGELIAGSPGGAGRANNSGLVCRCPGMRQPKNRKRSSSLSVGCGIVGRLVEVRSIESETLIDFHLFFFVPLSRMNDPIIIIFDTKADAKISEDAQMVRYCCRPRLEMTAGIRMPVIMMSAIDVLNNAANCILRRQVCPERSTIGMGKATSRMSVMISAVPIVRSCA